MKIAIPVSHDEKLANYRVSGHAGQTRVWLIYDLSKHRAGQLLPAPKHVDLAKDELFHVFKDDSPHPLDGIDIIVAASAGDGFIRHMKKRRCEVLLTGETDPAAALTHIIAGEALPEQRFDITTTLCTLRDMFSRH